MHVSCRATRFLVSKGLDLGEVMRKVASKLDCKGGGHKIAAGGTIRGINKEELISLIDEQIELQMGGA
ncbi:MAG: DHH family phosphoesterase [Thermoplasmata archaeon]|nr:MAG: DHH family phosphoesterase [Thermoplasmata archaeon]